MAQKPHHNLSNSNEDFEEDLFNKVTEDEDDTDAVDTEDDDDDQSVGTMDDDDGDSDADLSDDDHSVDDDEEDDFDHRQRLPEDKDGNLLHKGKVAVKAGKDRGVFEKVRSKLVEQEIVNKSLAGRLAEISKAGTELLRRYNELKESRQYHEKIGLDEREYKQAAEIMALAKTDPRGALRRVLTIMNLNGHDLSDIGVSGPLDPREVARHVLELEQSKRPTEPVAPQMSPEKAAEEQARDFISRNQDVLQYENAFDIIARAKEKLPNMPLDEIWARIKAAANGQQQKKEPPQRIAPKPENRDVRQGKRSKLDISARSHSMSFEDIGKELLRDLKTAGFAK